MGSVSDNKTGKLRMILAILLTAFAFSGSLKAEPSVIRYLDDEAGFALLDQIGTDIKDGDKVCVFEPKQPTPTCDVTFRWMTRNPLIFVNKALIARWEVGTTLEIKKIFFNGKGLDTPPDVTAYNKALLDGREKDEKIDKTKTIVGLNKFPKGAPPELAVEAPAIEGDDFPDIYVPKLRKTKKKSKREVSELDMTIKAIKKSLKDKGLATYAFLGEPEAVDELPKSVRADYPNPLNGAVEVSVFQAQPILSMADYQSVNFRTITNATVNRSTLWKPTRTHLAATGGAGLQVQITTKMSSFVNIGWRYHTYNSIKARATYDEFDTTLIADSATRVNEQIVSADWGKRQSWTDDFFTSYAFGLDLAYTDVNYQSKVAGNQTTAPFVVAFARHNFLTAAPRTQARIGYQRYGYGISFGATLVAPVYNFRDKFTGEVAVPDRVTFTGDADEDLRKSLVQNKNPIGFELFLSVSYQPQRK